MATILFVRVKSELDEKELERRLLERKPQFHDIPGLAQKVYGKDETTGEMCGIYFFETKEALAKFRESELAQTIPTAYEATEIRREVYEVLYPLRPDRGPLTDWNE
ncbi:MAG: YdhR family protein [candidate division Zixibacteria bacterium]|nr:YdhR family protein [candidate division Zixibacteria bacterium]MDH3935933.1 YdhR family protein [candidate division Zixibacteria bacterium]MDH4034857.1 YdhR family protein [candidate division Zixibacteria bacterium]